MDMNNGLVYRVNFYPGSGGRFISSIVDLILSKSSNQIEFSDNNSAHFINYSNLILRSHQFPVADSQYKDIVLIFGKDDIKEISVNNLYKNALENITRVKQGLEPAHTFTMESFLRLYNQTHDHEYQGDELDQSSIIKLSRQMCKWTVWGMMHEDKEFTVIGNDPNILYINYRDIFTPAGTSWLGLHQLCRFMKCHAATNVQETWTNYVKNRNNLIDNELKWLYNSL